MTRTVHPIEVESFRILRSRLDASALPPLRRAVLERVIHSSADLAYADDLIADEAQLRSAHAALHSGAPIVADVEMVAAGITSRRAVCRLADAVAAPGLTRSAHAMRLAYRDVGPGAVWVIGCAPTALDELLVLDAAPALVVGLPVGFVGAAESKARLRASGLPAVSNVSEKGGSAVAAAALNALLYTACPDGADDADGAGGAAGNGAERAADARHAGDARQEPTPSGEPYRAGPAPDRADRTTGHRPDRQHPLKENRT